MEKGSFFAVVRAGTGVLLGGVREHKSSRFARERDADSWAETVSRTNEEAGRDVRSISIVPSNLDPEIGPSD